MIWCCATSLQFCADKTQRRPTSYLAGVSCGLWSVVAEKMGLTLVPSAGLCTTVVWASWGEVGDTLPCREGDGSGLGGWARGKRKGVGKGTRKRCRGIPTNKRAHHHKALELQYTEAAEHFWHYYRVHGPRCRPADQHCSLQDHCRAPRM